MPEFEAANEGLPGVRPSLDEVVVLGHPRWLRPLPLEGQPHVWRNRKPGASYECPCCGYPTMTERQGYEICPLCFWEDDGQDDPYAENVWGGPNGPESLSSARANFSRHMKMYVPERDSTIGGPNSELERQTKLALAAVFEALRASGEKERPQLWTEVQQLKDALHAETSRRVREYEERHRR